MWITDQAEADAATTGCIWVIPDGCCEEEFGLPAVWTNAEQMAVDILYVLSGRQFSLCWSKIRICDNDRCQVQEEDAWDLIGRRSNLSTPLQWRGVGNLPVGCRCAPSACSCRPDHSVRLPHRNPVEIGSVTIGGVVMPEASYRLDGRWLIRTDGEDWPSQDMNAAPGTVGSWEVNYLHGVPAPIGGGLTAGRMACEIGLAIDCSDRCRLPDRIQTIVRAGETVAFLDPMQFLDKGRTGIGFVDGWLATVNRSGATRRARVRAAGARRGRAFRNV